MMKDTLKIGDILVGKYSGRVKLKVLSFEGKTSLGVIRVKVCNPTNPNNSGISTMDALESAFDVEKKA